MERRQGSTILLKLVPSHQLENTIQVYILYSLNDCGQQSVTAPVYRSTDWNKHLCHQMRCFRDTDKISRLPRRSQQPRTTQNDWPLTYLFSSEWLLIFHQLSCCFSVDSSMALNSDLGSAKRAAGVSNSVTWPCFMTSTLWESVTELRRWAMTNTVVDANSRLNVSCISASVSVSMEAVASSRIIICGVEGEVKFRLVGDV